MRALILDQGEDRGSLAATRALWSDGWTVGVGAPRRGMASSSKACSMWHHVPAAEDGLDAFVAAVVQAIRDGEYEIVMSADDSGTLALSRYRDRFGAVVPYAGHNVVVRAQHKLELAHAAEIAGLSVPLTVSADAAAIAGVRTPVVVKAALHTTLSEGAPGRLSARLARTREEVAEHVSRIRSAGGEPLLQDVVAGTLMAFSFVADRDGSIIAVVQQEALHTWPLEVGVSARARTVPTDPVLASGVARLVSELRWFGMAELQFMRSAGQPPMLIDCNARPYGSLGLAVAAGVNLPAIWARLATGRPITVVRAPKPGTTYQWFPRDVKASIAEDGFVRGTIDALRTAPSATHSIWKFDDPWPAIRHYGGKTISALRDVFTTFAPRGHFRR